MDTQPSLSIVVPVYNEEESLEQFHATLLAALSKTRGPIEILYIDDASTDASLHIASSLESTDAITIVVLTLLTNSTKGGALEIGFQHAKGDIVVTIDADLQDDPKEIEVLIAQLKEADVAIGWKQQRLDPPHKVLASRLMNILSNIIIGSSIHDMNSGLKAYRKEALEHLHLPGSLYRFIPHVLHKKGFTVVEVPVQHHKRQFGISKFGFLHRIKGLLDLLTIAFLLRFQQKPFHFFGSIGISIFLVGFVCASYLTALWLQGISIGSRPLLLLSVLLIVVGVQVISVGLLAEMLLYQKSTTNTSRAFRKII